MNRPWILMNQAGETPGGGTPGTPPAPPPPAASSTPQPADENQPWFKERLERARRDALADVGITDPDKAKKILADAAKAEEERKSQGEKLGETSKELERLRAENARKDEAIKTQVTAEMAALTPEHQAVIRELAPDTDPTAQLRHIAILRKTWGSPTAASTPGAPPPPPVTPPANTSGPPAAPPPAAPESPPDHSAVYAELNKTNPFAAANYAQAHPEAYAKRA